MSAEGARSGAETPELPRWPGLRTVLGCCVLAAVAVALDAYFSAQEGLLSRAPDYDGVSYLLTARSALHLLRALHLRTGLGELNGSIAPLWISAVAFQQFIFGDGQWQAFTARFWAMAPLLTLVYWIVRARGHRSLAITAVSLTALLPVASASVRASSWEFVTGQLNQGGDWGLEDLRPDFFAIVLVLCSIVPLAEHYRAPRRSTYLVSAAFAAAAVLAKPSTAPVGLVAWGLTLGVIWVWNRGQPGIVRWNALAVGLLAVLLSPWALKGGVSGSISRYVEASGAFRATYAANLNLPDTIGYFLVQIPTQLGHIEAWVVIAGSVLLTVALLRGRLEVPEWIYGGLFLLFYAILTVSPNKNVNVGMWITLPLWIFFLAGASRLASARWPATVVRASPSVLAATGVYVLAIYGLGAFALANWPANEQRSNAQQLTVTTELAQELARYVSVDQCFAYAPGPGWPASLEYLLTDSNGRAPASTPVDVDPRSTTISDYVAEASQCPAVIAYREDILQVAQVFIAFPVRQPYLRAVAEWVRSPGSGYYLDRSWHFSDLAPFDAHTLGRFHGVSLTADLYIRTRGK
jgi:hypothetical protein